MRVTQVSYTRVLSDHSYGNHQASLVAQVDEGEKPAQVLAELRDLACQAVAPSSARVSLDLGCISTGTPAGTDPGYVGADEDDWEDLDGAAEEEEIEADEEGPD